MDKVTQDDINVLAVEADKARDCAKACATSRRGPTCVACSCKSRIKKIIDGVPGLSTRLDAQNEQSASNELLNAQQSAQDVYNSYNSISYEEIYNSFAGECISSECRENRGKGGNWVGVGQEGIMTHLLKSRDHVYFRSTLTPAQDARRSAVIQGEIDALAPKINDILSKIGDRDSINEALTAQGARLLGPLQEDYARISRKINDAWISAESKTRLHEELKKLLKPLGKAAAKAGVAGQNAAQAIDELNEIVVAGKKGVKCMLEKGINGKMKCTLGKAYWPVLGITALSLALAVMFILRPYVALFNTMFSGD